ncbi:MAG: glycosyltransferase family 4 protein [Patescibacteria group bacterium]|nr:glycosyltransferase family 4 protein [Patescibacteria group bacterium]
MNNNLPTKGRLDVVVKYFYPLMAGIEVNIMNVYSHLAEKGWEVYIHTTTDMPDMLDSLQKREEINNLHIIRYRWQWFGFSPKVEWDKTSALCLHNFNVFPHSWLFLKVWWERFFKKSRIKVFLTPHGGFTPEWPTFSPGVRFFKRIYHNTLGIFFINHIVDGLRSVSEWEMEKTVKLGVKSEKVRVIQNGLEKEVLEDVEELASSEVRELVTSLTPYVIQIGRIHPIKNQKVVVEALQLLPQEIKFAIVGPVTDFDYEKELRKTMKKLGLKRRVIFLGVKIGIDKYYLLRHSLAGVHMAYWESYCNAVHEYMSQGCICVVSKDTALEELVKNNQNGYCVKVDDSKAVAEKIKYIYQSRGNKEMLKMMERNVAFTKGHSWEAIADRVEDFYNRYLEE